MPSDPFTEYSTATAFVVGMVHGVGVETPTQVLLFTAAAGVAGTFAGTALVIAFVAGLLLGNLVLTALATAGFMAGRKVPYLYAALAASTATVSALVGTAYLFGRTDLLPSFLGG